MKIVIINGTAQSGKSTFVEFCQNYQTKLNIQSPERHVHIYNISSVDYVKEVAKQIGWDGIKDERGRLFLSDLKDAMTKYDDIPVKKIIEKINSRLKTAETLKIPTKNFIFFLHIREPKEIGRLAKEFNAFTLFIQRPGQKTSFNNHADRDVGIYNYDKHYWNVGDLRDLERGAKDFIDKLLTQDWFSTNPRFYIWDENSYPLDFSIDINKLMTKLP